ncbi:MAG: hypothetical protein CO094_05705 [Anaerolineae bacterium CG_4_9_14_3_um_filter_57_17]|nr:AAA domain-containing protein [bacterium]NCT19751.1 AAA domain-containing protein [bacterium]OIO85186.1 MAG: hypothetical protein AUK01_06810 [Anaerolineae bacterium CG2_30_57_67]PJB66916.1 MAG: hypothetical protein CO094_05705 [Anaerolineae bacterium CG_4_9_14_3_um_filter_57_17]
MLTMTGMSTLFGTAIDVARFKRALQLMATTSITIGQSGNTYTANVHKYQVKLVEDNGKYVRYTCECVDFKTHAAPCKHVMALAMKVDAQAHLQAAAQNAMPASTNFPAEDALPEQEKQPVSAAPEASADFTNRLKAAIGAAIQQVAEETLAVLQAGYVPLLVGTTGTGKTSAVRLVAAALNARMVEVAGSESYTDSDMVGVVMPTGLRFPGPIAEAAEYAQNMGKTLLFLDEFTRFSPRAAESLLRLLLPIGQQDAHRMGIAHKGDVRGTSAPFWGNVWMPADDVPIVLACNPWGNALDPALVRRTVPIFVDFDPRVANLFGEKVKQAIEASWKGTRAGELPLPIEYGEISRASSPDDPSVVARYMTRLRVLDSAAEDAFRAITGAK